MDKQLVYDNLVESYDDNGKDFNLIDLDQKIALDVTNDKDKNYVINNVDDQSRYKADLENQGRSSFVKIDSSENNYNTLNEPIHETLVII